MATTADSTMPRGRKRKDGFSKNGEKRFLCQADGCGRSFTRAEHLQRHLLNHSTGEFTCTRCRAHFKRRDLLGENPVSCPHEWDPNPAWILHVHPLLHTLHWQEWMAVWSHQLAWPSRHRSCAVHADDM